MGLEIVFVGTKFLYNKGLGEYALKEVQKIAPVEGIVYIKDADNSLFLRLEELVLNKEELVIVCSKQNYATIGKLLCTITEDNLVLQEDGMLIPSNTTSYRYNTYLLTYKDTEINVVLLDDMQRFPKLLIKSKVQRDSFHLFDEEEQSAKALLEPLSQTYEVRLDFIRHTQKWLEVIVESKKYGDVAKFLQAVKQLLPSKVIAEKNIAAHIISTLSRHNLTITFAESCTGGLLSYFFTKNNGASNILEGALVTYSNRIKSSWLAVEQSLFEQVGAVSAEVVEEMSEGALGVSNADFAISISGIAGDGGGSQEKPVGTVYIGIRSKTKHKEERFYFQGDRNYVQYQSVLQAVEMLILENKELFFGN